MNSFIKYIPESFDDHKAFVELLLSIIDTKLQFVKHRTNSVIADYSEYTASDSHTTDFYFSEVPLSDFSSGEQMIGMIEQYSKTTNLLLLLRNKLGAHNVSLIYDLLNNNQFLNYDNQSLERLLEEQRF